jgi:membrane protein
MHEPRGELTRWQRAVRFSIDLAIVGAQQLKQDRASQMASALAFRTLFGLVPTLLVATLLVRALGGFGEFEQLLNDRLAAMQLDDVRAGTAGAAGATTDAASSEAADATLARFIMSVVDAVEQINLTAITWVGVAVLMYAAISLMTTIETSFNVICRASDGRPWTRRVPIYWTVLTLAPVIMTFVAVVDLRVDSFLEATLASGWLLRSAAIAWSLSITTLLLLAIYKLVPNAAVPTRNALAGAFTATILIEVLKRSFGIYVENATSMRQITGSLGLLPLFMFWVYLFWLTILFGLEVAQVLTRRAGRELESMRGERMPSIVDPASLLVVAGAVAARFAQGRTSEAADVGSTTGLPSAAVQIMLERLADEGVLHRVGADGDAFTFARPPEEVPAGDLLRIGHGIFGASGPASGERAGGILARIRDAERAAADGVTAASLGRQMGPATA